MKHMFTVGASSSSAGDGFPIFCKHCGRHAFVRYEVRCVSAPDAGQDDTRFRCAARHEKALGDVSEVSKGNSDGVDCRGKLDRLALGIDPSTGNVADGTLPNKELLFGGVDVAKLKHRSLLAKRPDAEDDQRGTPRHVERLAQAGVADEAGRRLGVPDINGGHKARGPAR